jgi:hypothetical protein
VEFNQGLVILTDGAGKFILKSFGNGPSKAIALFFNFFDPDKLIFADMVCNSLN